MPLLKDGKLIDDPWSHIADEVAIPASGQVIVGLKRWREERDSLIKRKDPAGVRLQSDHTAGDVADDLEHLGVVALAFPVFKDGRAYSNARRLRERHGYTGEIRAIGNVLRDQYLFMLRCGFDALEVKEGETEKDWQKATKAFSVFFQPAADDQETVVSLRHRD
ncbi:MAG: hypothetical protein CFH03_02311 [Alphaproteobacteria bacterium MarineAlpha3_Bin2]|jgi:uncharacterized protein (DUF934 family)|nr:MAG: hypothetical protein CFH02_00349 [Alphaproteobacteria bacterium MarineAlpha3_Bin1]PPR70958.1 MAG: hypothetical protein CFH03_02311 [Alphaproteobacteria bacterium MarineAlpha3_Bin2]